MRMWKKGLRCIKIYNNLYEIIIESAHHKLDQQGHLLKGKNSEGINYIWNASRSH